MSSARPQKKYDRTNLGLRDALFDELEDLHNGSSTPSEAMAFSKLAENILDTIAVEARQAEHDYEVKRLDYEERRLTHQLLLEHKNAKEIEEISEAETIEDADFSEVDPPFLSNMQETCGL